MRKSQGGFTLMELLVTASMLALLTAAGGAMFSAGTRAAGKARRCGEMIAAGQAALQALARDIRAAVAHEHVQLTALDAYYEGRNADTIDFLMKGRPPGAGVTEGGLLSPAPEVRFPDGDLEPTTFREVGYYVDNDPKTEARWLLRREDDSLDDDPLGGGMVTLAGPFVAELNLEFYDGLEWRAGWELERMLPRAVRIEIIVVDRDEIENPMLFSTTVPILSQ